MVESLKSAGAFFCLDMRAMGFEFYGSWTDSVNLAAFSVFLVPCASRVSIFDGSISGGEETCI